MYVYCINSFGTATVGVIDITSSRDFPAIDLYLSRADSVMLFYDEDDDTSVRELLHLRDKVKAVREERTDMHVTIVATKYDKDDGKYDDEKCRKLMDSMVLELGNKCTHVVTSAKNDMNVGEAFEGALNELVRT